MKNRVREDKRTLQRRKSVDALERSKPSSKAVESDIYSMSSTDFVLLLEATLDLLSPCNGDSEIGPHSQPAEAATPCRSSGWGLGQIHLDTSDPLSKTDASNTSSPSSTSTSAHGEEKDKVKVSQFETEIANIAKLITKKPRKGKSSTAAVSKSATDCQRTGLDPEGPQTREGGSGSKNTIGIECLPPETLARILRYARENIEQSDPVNAPNSRRIRMSRANASFGKQAGPPCPNGLFAQCKRRHAFFGGISFAHGLRSIMTIAWLLSLQLVCKAWAPVICSVAWSRLQMSNDKLLTGVLSGASVS